MLSNVTIYVIFNCLKLLSNYFNKDGHVIVDEFARNTGNY